MADLRCVSIHGLQMTSLPCRLWKRRKGLFYVFIRFLQSLWREKTGQMIFKHDKKKDKQQTVASGLLAPRPKEFLAALSRPSLLLHSPASSKDLWVSATLDDRKLSARALFDDSSHRQIQLSIRVQTGKTLCYRLPFHVYVSVEILSSSIPDPNPPSIFNVFCTGHSRLHPSNQLLPGV